MPRLTVHKRIQRIENLLNRHATGQEVSVRDFTSVAGIKQRKEYKSRWQEQMDLRAQLKNRPAEIVSYEQKLNKALLANGRYESYVGPKHTSEQREKLKIMGNKAEGLFENALECLEEALGDDPSLRIWFDRDIAFGPHGNLGTNPEQMPRVITSKSFENLNQNGARNNFGIKTKAEIKADLLRELLDQLKSETASDEEKSQLKEAERIQSIKLKSLLKGLKSKG